MHRCRWRKVFAIFFGDESGAAASEYAVSLAFIVAAVAAAASLFDLTAVFPAIVEKISALINQ
jgi:Flp pilus assembly pilin Flp